MEKSSFFNSVNGDRKYKAEEFAAYFNSFITNGIFPNPSTNLQVISNNNMTVTVKSGKAWINGYVYINDSDLTLTLDNADGVLNRIDRIVIRFDTTGRVINAKVKKGTFASLAAAPTLQRDSDFYELGIADVEIDKGVTSITQGKITDLRLDTSVCGVVNSLIQADTTTLLNQYTAKFDEKEIQFEQDFNNWFDDIKDVLGTDVAGNLQNQIGTLTNLTTTDKSSLVGAVNENSDEISILSTDVGTKSDLTTTNKTNLVSAVNELKASDDAHKAESATTATQPHGLAKNKLDATVAPTVNDDSGDGYGVNSIWINLTSDKSYICVDSTVGTAVWKEITKESEISVKLYNTTSPSIANTTFTILNFDSEFWDTQNLHNTSSNTSRITIPVTGKYLFICNTVWQASNTTGFRRTFIKVNNTTSYYLADSPANGASDIVNTTGVIELNLNQNDYVEMGVYHNAGISVSLAGTSAYTSFSARKVD